MKDLYWRGLVAIVVLMGIFLLLGAPASAEYTFTTIDFTTRFEKLSTTAYGINDSGDIVGSYSDDEGVSHGFLDAGGSFTTVDLPDYLDYETLGAYGINGSGDIVGSFYDNTYGIYYAFLYSGGGFAVVDTGAAETLGAWGINSSGAIVGSYFDATGFEHGFLDVGGNVTTIDVLSVPESIAWGINDPGDIVGFYLDTSGQWHGFLDHAGSFTAIDFPGASKTFAYGINNSGDIVGVYVDSKRLQHGFLDVGGVFTSIDFPGAKETQVFGINSAGQIVGQYDDSHGNSHGFVATPSSEVLVPAIPSGPTSGMAGTSYSYSTGGSVSALGNPVEYQFDWKGDGSNLSAYGSATQSNTWTVAGTYSVRARARDTINTSAVSDWSSGLAVTISGNAEIPIISVTPISYDFGSVKVKRSKTASFKVTNSGKANLTIISTSIKGADASMFTISGGGSKTIKPGKSLTIRVAFKPTSTGSESATLEITSNDPVTPTLDIALTGTGQ